MHNKPEQEATACNSARGRVDENGGGGGNRNHVQYSDNAKAGAEFGSIGAVLEAAATASRIALAQTIGCAVDDVPQRRRRSRGTPWRLSDFAAHFVVEANGCWRWVRAMQKGGYGRVSIGGKLMMAHRAVYEAARGPIPEGFDIDHLCRNRACVNPAHLDAVTHRENVLRGESPNAAVSRSGICRRGHIRETGRPGRDCLACRRITKNRQRAARRAARRAGAA